jgi:large subunit ribosomal protein L30
MLKVTLKKSVIGYNKKQRDTVKALGLGKVGSSVVVHPENVCVMGMVNKIPHLLNVEKLQEPVEVKE